MSIWKSSKITKIKNNILFLPSSKALSIRTLYLPFIGIKKVKIENLSYSDDFKVNLKVITKLGLKVQRMSGLKGISITASSDKTILSNVDNLYIGNSGLGLRFLVTLLSFLNKRCKIKMGEQLAKRPVLEDCGHLLKLGVKIKQKKKYIYIESSKYKNPPAKIRNLEIRTTVTSQYLSSLLFFGWKFGIKKIRLISEPVSFSYIRTTLRLLKMVGIKWYYKGNTFILRGKKIKREFTIMLPPDASIASNFLVLSCILKEKIVIKDFKRSTIEPDFVILDILEKVGAQYRFDGYDLIFYGDIKRDCLSLDLRDNPDLLPILCILLLFLKRGGVIKNIAHTTFKESQRNKVLVKELSRLGVWVKDNGNILRIGGKNFKDLKLKRNIMLNCYNDHRIFMAFAVMGAVTGHIKICNPEAVTKSFPDFLNVIINLK